MGCFFRYKNRDKDFSQCGGLPFCMGGGKGLVADPAGYSDGGGGRRVSGKISAGEDEKLQILFITALPDYIEEGYDVSALHYLIKPIRRDKFFQCLDKAAKKEEEESYLLLTTVQGEKVRAAQKEIMYMEAFAHTVQIHTKEEILEVRCGINTLEEQLEEKILSGAIAPISWGWLIPRE